VLINDVSGGLADPLMAAVAAHAGVAFVAMHCRAHSSAMTAHANYDQIVADVTWELQTRLEALVSEGLDEKQILDSGLGFAKRAEHDWQLLAGLDRLQALGRPVLLRESRKSFLASLIQPPVQEPLPPHQRDHLTCAVSAVAAAAHSVWCIRALSRPDTRWPWRRP
jgi:dihydropteroate synthase